MEGERCWGDPEVVGLNGVDGTAPLSAAMSWSGILILVFTLLQGGCAIAPGPGLQAPLYRSFAEVVDSVTTSPPLDRSRWGIEVRDAQTGASLYSLNSTTHFVPASNMKLVVTAVALGELGPDFRYQTRVFALGAGADEPLPNGGGPGEVDHILIRASGDPTLSRRFHPDGPDPIEALADSVVAAGVRRVRGDLVIDLSYFDDQPVHPSWEVGDLAFRYAAPISAFAVEEATLRVVVEPGDAVGAPATVYGPTGQGAVSIAAGVTTAAPGERRRLRARRRYLTDLLEIGGVVPLNAAPDTLSLAAPYPAHRAAVEFRAALARRGVQVEGDIRLTESVAGVDQPARLLTTWESPPLSEIVSAVLKPSQNWIAEQLLKTLGAERGRGGSWAEGLRVERRYLIDEVGLDSTSFWLSDASGLSVQNLLTPEAVVELLEFARQEGWGPIYQAALAGPGQEGTLEWRLNELEGRLMAKTGTVTHVNSLSGYLRTNTGRGVTFSIMSNVSGVRAAIVREAIDSIVRAIAADNFQGEVGRLE